MNKHLVLVALASLVSVNSTSSFRRRLNVSCGGHYASNCANCPQGNGAAWCNGDCTWKNNQCVKKPKKECGNGKSADKCAQCPSGSCASADCTWHPNTSLCRDSFSNDVRTASVHLVYSPPVSDAAWWFQRVKPTASADATYFSSNGHRFGYGGIQQVYGNTGKVIFSLWDQGGCDQDINPNCDKDNIAKTIACGEGVTCTDFGGEGTGRKSYIDITNKGFPKVNEDYYFVTQAAYMGNRKMQYTGYFYMEGKWKLLSRIQVSTDASENWSLSGLYSFVEQWTETQTTSERSALYGPSFMAQTDGKNFVQVDSATFDHGTLENHEHVNAWQAGANDDHAVGIATGGYVEQEVLRGKTFSYKKVNQPSLLHDFSSYIPCLNKASTTASIDACLKSTTSCEDKKGKFKVKGLKKKKHCKWVGKNTKRCKRIAEDENKLLSDVCPKACDNCVA